jgi:predicted ester cyclase
MTATLALKHVLLVLDPRRHDGFLAQHAAEGSVLHGPCPLDDLCGAHAQAERFWVPLLRAFPDLERRDDILMSGASAVAPEGSDWVAGTGHYAGTFTAPFLGIPPTGRLAWLRYGEFHRLGADGRIAETYLLLDLPDLMRQAGASPLPRPDAAEFRVPGPASHDGILLAPADAAETKASYDLVMAMIGGLGRYDRASLGSMGQDAYWHDDMMWYGPGGIGSTRGIAGFQAHYQRHFLRAFPDRKGGNHKARFAEGAYVASTGWPSVRATWSGDWLGAVAPRVPIGMRVMDFWRRDGHRLRENWVFIDIPDLHRQIGSTVFSALVP